MYLVVKALRANLSFCRLIFCLLNPQAYKDAVVDEAELFAVALEAAQAYRSAEEEVLYGSDCLLLFDCYGMERVPRMLRTKK